MNKDEMGRYVVERRDARSFLSEKAKALYLDKFHDRLKAVSQ